MRRENPIYLDQWILDRIVEATTFRRRYSLLFILVRQCSSWATLWCFPSHYSLFRTMYILVHQSLSLLVQNIFCQRPKFLNRLDDIYVYLSMRRHSERKFEKAMETFFPKYLWCSEFDSFWTSTIVPDSRKNSSMECFSIVFDYLDHAAAFPRLCYTCQISYQVIDYTGHCYCPTRNLFSPFTFTFSFHGTSPCSTFSIFLRKLLRKNARENVRC